MSLHTRRTVAVHPGMGSDLSLVQNAHPMRNSVRPCNQVTIKSYEQLLPHFSNEPGLEYVEEFVYSNNSVYRGQMKKVDEAMRIQMQSSGAGKAAGMGGALQNRLSAKCDSVKDIQGND